MKTIYDGQEFQEILASPIDDEIKEILRQKVELLKEFLETFDLADLMFIVLVDPGDSLDAIRKELGFCPLTNQVDGARYPSLAYQPSFEHAVAHGTVFELVFCMSDSGLADVVLVPDRIDVDQTLLEFCRKYASHK